MRNKKFIALAMAAIVGMTSAPAVYQNVIVAEAAVGDSTAKELDIDKFGAANSGDEELTGDFELVYTFTNKTKNISENYYNYIVEVFDGGNYITARADNFGWFAGTWDTDGSTKSWGDGADSWDDFRTVMRDASVTVTVKREGQKVTITNDIVSNADNTKKYNFVGTFEMKNLPDTVKVHITGERVALSNIKAELKAEPTVAPTTEPASGSAVSSGSSISSGSAVTSAPSITAEPTAEPTTEPSAEPTAAPTAEPSAEPTAAPTTEPSAEPTQAPTPTKKPSTTAKKATIVVKKGKKSVSAVSVKAKKTVKLNVSVNSKAKITAAKLSKKAAKVAKVTLKNNKLTVKGLKKGKVTIKLSAKKTAKYKAATKTVKVTVK